MSDDAYLNPFRPGPGHAPPYLAGRQAEQATFLKLLRQLVIADNLIISGLRGIGKSVLLESFKPVARADGWLWVGEDFTEARGLTEERTADGIINDLALAAAPIFGGEQMTIPPGFGSVEHATKIPLDYTILRAIYDASPGVPTDKLKALLREIAKLMRGTVIKGIVFAYDEAQNMGDRAASNEFPLSMLLDVFKSIQRPPEGLPVLLVLSGLPTLFDTLNACRAYSERMFEVITLSRLPDADARAAIIEPIRNTGYPIALDDGTVMKIVEMANGYPFFLQFICKEAFDTWSGRYNDPLHVPADAILRKLDQRFFAGRWKMATDRQRDFMTVAAALSNSDGEFTVPEIVGSSQTLDVPFNQANAQMMIKTLMENDFIIRTRRGRYSFAVPLLDRFINRNL